jgi:hypothetical protein
VYSKSCVSGAVCSDYAGWPGAYTIDFTGTFVTTHRFAARYPNGDGARFQTLGTVAGGVLCGELW